MTDFCEYAEDLDGNIYRLSHLAYLNGNYNWELVQRALPRERYCGSCGLEHGASEFNSKGECEITQVKKLEAEESKVKKHNENIRTLFWERYIKGGHLV